MNMEEKISLQNFMRLIDIVYIGCTLALSDNLLSPLVSSVKFQAEFQAMGNFLVDIKTKFQYSSCIHVKENWHNWRLMRRGVNFHDTYLGEWTEGENVHHSRRALELLFHSQIST